MRRFVQEVRIAEGLISKASVLGTHPSKLPNAWNELQRELALARARAAHSSNRQSRFSYWAQALQSNLGSHAPASDEK